jgi:hypothetical protein
MNINVTRVLLGGLLAGLVLNIGEFVLNVVVLGAQMKEFSAAHNFQDPGGSFIAVATVLTFILGIVFVWLYALIRPRLGPGVKTAIVAGFIMWFAIYFYVGIIYMLIFAMPTNLVMISFVWGLVEYALAAIAGAWVYKEV